MTLSQYITSKLSITRTQANKEDEHQKSEGERALALEQRLTTGCRRCSF